MASPRMGYIMAVTLTMFVFLHCGISFTSASYPTGVCYGMKGNNLPAPKDVINLYKEYGIQRIRMYDPNHEVLEALRGSNLAVSLGVPNEDISSLAGSQEAANSWVATNVSPYNDVSFVYLSVGNEVIPGAMARYVAHAIQNVHNALVAAGHGAIKVSTVVPTNVLGKSYPPSQGAFSAYTAGDMTSVLRVLSKIGSPLMVNVYPYFAYAADPVHISQDYALFTAKSPTVHDGDLQYLCLFDAMVDSFYAAMERVGVTNVNITVAETGWPSAGNGQYTTRDLAKIYNENLVNHVASSGTPRRPNARLDTFVYAMFNENLKPDGIEQNFGLFDPNKKPVYALQFSNDHSRACSRGCCSLVFLINYHVACLIMLWNKPFKEAVSLILARGYIMY